MTAPDGLSSNLESLKLALGRMERATTRVELALRRDAVRGGATMTSTTREVMETKLESAIERIDALLKETPHG